MERDHRKRHLKRALRRSIIASILGLDPAERSFQEARLLSLFRELPGYAEATTVLLYVKAFAEELDMRCIFLDAFRAGKRVVCPRVERTLHRLRLFEIGSLTADLHPGILGIPEPREACLEVDPEVVDWALIPCLAFDMKCYRLGRGGGHYDRLLPRMRPDTQRWALGFDCQLVGDLPIEPHDAPLDGIATVSEIITRPLVSSSISLPSALP
jgi:5-formyltetrahydrofolate cyclo-ligase